MTIEVVPTALWKLTIKTGGTSTKMSPLEFCREQGVIGIGWQLHRRPGSPAEAKRLFSERYPKRSPVGLNILAARMSKDDHAWVYGHRTYYACRITSEWKYRDGPGWDEHDIHHMREAEWQDVPELSVPGVIKRKLTQRGTAQIITRNEAWCRYSHWLRTSSPSQEPSHAPIDFRATRAALMSQPDLLFDALDADETEDVVGLFLQAHHGWYLIKSSAYRSQRDVECQFQRVTNGRSETAYMQVKSGRKKTLDATDYLKFAESDSWIYLFSTATTPYRNQEQGNERVVCISKKDIQEFVTSNLDLLPLPVRKKLELWVVRAGM